MKKILNKFHQETLTIVIIIIVFWNISSGISLKLEKKKNGATFSNFNPFPSLPASFATDDRNQFQCLNMVLNNRSASFFLNL